MVPRIDFKMNIPINAAAGIPAAVGALVANMHKELVISLFNGTAQVSPEGGISVGMAFDNFPVQKNVTVHIDTVKMDHYLFLWFCIRMNHAVVPCISSLIKVAYRPAAPGAPSEPQDLVGQLRRSIDQSLRPAGLELAA